MSSLTLSTPDRALDHYLNGWCLYQVTACRLMARTSSTRTAAPSASGTSFRMWPRSCIPGLSAPENSAVGRLPSV